MGIGAFGPKAGVRGEKNTNTIPVNSLALHANSFVPLFSIAIYFKKCAEILIGVFRWGPHMWPPRDRDSVIAGAIVIEGESFEVLIPGQ
jgi:hypothetical protein